MREFLFAILVCTVCAYLFGWFFAKGALHEFSNFLVKHFDKYIKSKKEKENGNEKTQ